jgi:hypothetical protein
LNRQRRDALPPQLSQAALSDRGDRDADVLRVLRSLLGRDHNFIAGFLGTGSLRKRRLRKDRPSGAAQDRHAAQKQFVFGGHNTSPYQIVVESAPIHF